MLDHQGMFVISLVMMLLTVLFNMLIWAKRYGGLEKTVAQHVVELRDFNSVLYKHNGTMNFLSKNDHEKHINTCPRMICAKIKEVHAAVNASAAKMETDRLLATRMQENMKSFEHVISQQQVLVDGLGQTVADLKLQLAVIKETKPWNGSDRRIG